MPAFGYRRRFYYRLVEDRTPHSLIFGLLLVAAMTFTGCGDEEQRAISPGSAGDFATAVAYESGLDDAMTSTRDSGERRIYGQGLLPEAERVYFAWGGDIWHIGEFGSAELLIEGEEILSFDSSGTGDFLVYLHTERDRAGVERVRISAGSPDDAEVTPISAVLEQLADSAISSLESVALTPDGSGLAVSGDDGALSASGPDGSLRSMIAGDDDRRPGRMFWSADGEIVAYLDPWLPGEPSELWVAVPNLEIRQVVANASSGTTGVADAVWIPGTTSIAYSAASGATIEHGGDVFLVDVLTGERDLLISTGQFAPVAGVANLAVSPSGQRLALTAFVPGERYPVFDGLWIIDLESRSGTEVRPGSDSTVTDLWWLGQNLLFRVIDEPRTSLPGTYTGQEPFKLLEYNPSLGTMWERFDSEAHELDDGDDDDDDDD